VVSGDWWVVSKDTKLMFFNSKDLMLVIGVFIWVIIIVMWILSVSAPQFHPENIRGGGSGMAQSRQSQSPSFKHPLGTDQEGRDVMALVIGGSRAYLLPGLLSVIIALSLGTILGSLSGYFAGQNAGIRYRNPLTAIEPSINYLLNLIDSLPQLALIFIICSVFSPNIYLIVAILGLMNATKVAALIRSKIISLKEEQFIEAAKELGVSPLKIVSRHLLWYNCRPIFSSGAAHTFADVILFETTLRYIWNVVGAQHSWGELLVDSKGLIFSMRPIIIGYEIKDIHLWWVWFFPALAIVLTILGCHLLGDALIARLETQREL